ncbi:hypothetical protein [Mucilaginibacter polytrichastri]|uniref:Uncharacterized protein n=1 Tax=Mucilaginibacter polytrichastri TaxID=1302689 RepID=A0A1Q5ZT44_9SPHI|nr:hypothetical protein [Mucilaginibacter polytrichastri]OKS84848.1 hypothetical protein RG47T_0285 [Mucilaginibacter polytrichastri]SFS48690.1 hypothetical protein SAMN04487890_101789 [Mucilaginibacter polytrichastri]
MTSQINTANQKIGFKNKGLIIAIICIAIIGLIVSLNWHQLRAQYHLLTGHQFKAGDKLYATPKIFEGDPKNNSVILMRLVRPLTVADIDKMNINAAKKEVLKKNIDPQAQSYLIYGGESADYQRFNEAHTAFAGKYLGKAVLNFRNVTDKKLVPETFCIIEPNEDVMIGKYLHLATIPENYTWADNTFYTFYDSLTDQELPKFIKK